jgi:hypothetical protein
VNWLSAAEDAEHDDRGGHEAADEPQAGVRLLRQLTADDRFREVAPAAVEPVVDDARRDDGEQHGQDRRDPGAVVLPEAVHSGVCSPLHAREG